MTDNVNLDTIFSETFGVSSANLEDDTRELCLLIGTINNIADDENLFAVALQAYQKNGLKIPNYEEFLELAKPSGRMRKILSDIQLMKQEIHTLKGGVNIHEDDLPLATPEQIEEQIEYYNNVVEHRSKVFSYEVQKKQLNPFEKCPYEQRLEYLLQLSKDHKKNFDAAEKIERRIPYKEAEIDQIPYARDIIEFVCRTLPHEAQPTAKSYQVYIDENHKDLVSSLDDFKLPVKLSEQSTQRHTYITGASGSGKSELLKILTYAHYVNGRRKNGGSCVVLDPHGDLVLEIMRHEKYCNEEGAKRILYLSPDVLSNKSFVINPLQPPKSSTEEEREVIAQEVTGVFEELLKGGIGGSLSVNMRSLLLPCLTVLIDKGDATLLDLKSMLLEQDKTAGEYHKLGCNSDRPFIAHFFEEEFLSSHHNGTKASLLTKLNSLLMNTRFFNTVIGKTSVDLTKELNNKKLVLFNLSKGTLGADATEALGRFVVSQLKCMALKRQKQDKSKRVPVHVLIDECHNFIGKSTETILAEARKYGLHLTLAQQIVGQGMDADLQKILIGNTEIKIMGKTRDDRTAASLMDKEKTDLQSLSVGDFYCRLGGNMAFKFHVSNDFVDKTGQVDDATWSAFIESLDKSPYYKSPFKFKKKTKSKTSEETTALPKAKI